LHFSKITVTNLNQSIQLVLLGPDVFSKYFYSSSFFYEYEKIAKVLVVLPIRGHIFTEK